MQTAPTPKSKLKSTKVFFALLIVVLFFFAPVVYPMQEESKQEQTGLQEFLPALNPFASSADACPWACIKCTSWDPDAWPRTCLTYECTDASGGCGPVYQPPTISSFLNCIMVGANGWCIGSLSLDLTASDPQGQSVIISGDVNGVAFTCPNGDAACSIPLSEGTGNINYKVDSATGLSANGSTSYQLDITTPQIDGNINGSTGNSGWYISQTSVTASASDVLSGVAAFEMNVDNSGYTNYTDITFTDGIHTIQFRATDNAGNFSEVQQTILVDTTPPSLSAPGFVRLVDSIQYQAEDQTSGLSQFILSIEDKDQLRPNAGGTWSVSGMSYTNSVFWDGHFSNGTALVGYYPFTFTVQDVAGNQTSMAGSYEVKWRYLVYLGLAPDNNKEDEEENPLVYYGTGPIVPPAIEAPMPSTEPSTNTIPEELPPTPEPMTPKTFQGMNAQVSFSAGNQTANLPNTNSNPSTSSGQAILWGAAAATMLGATLAEWQKKREEEAARLAALIASNAGQGDEDEIPGDVLAKRRAKVIAKNQAKRDQEHRWEAARTAQKPEQMQNAIAKNNNLTQAEAEMSKVKPVTPYVAASYIDKDEEKWLKGQESQRAWETVQAQEQVKQKEGNRQTGETNKVWWIPSSVEERSREVLGTLPDILESARIEVPYLSFLSPGGILSFGRKTEVSTGIKMPTSQNETVSTEISNDGYSISTNTNPSINFGLKADNVSLGFKITSPVEVLENNYGGSIGYSVMASLNWSGNNALNKVWNSKITLDINHFDVDLSTGKNGHIKGNVSDGAYVSFKPVQVASVSVVVTVVAIAIVLNPLPDEALLPSIAETLRRILAPAPNIP